MRRRQRGEWSEWQGWVMGLVICGATLLGPSASAQPVVTLEAEVLEGSEAIAVPGASTPGIHYAMLHHKHAEDQQTFSRWLRSHESAPVRFLTDDGASHQAVLRRLKHCFGRGLLLYADPVRLPAKAVIRLDLPSTP